MVKKFVLQDFKIGSCWEVFNSQNQRFILEVTQTKVEFHYQYVYVNVLESPSWCGDSTMRLRVMDFSATEVTKISKLDAKAAKMFYGDA